MFIGKFDQLYRHVFREGWINNSSFVITEAMDLNPNDYPQLTKRIRAAKYSLYRDYPFLGTMMQELRIRLLKDIKGLNTMAVDKEGNVFIDVNFAEKELADDRCLMFVLAHEVMHVALLSLFRLSGRNMTVWNMATDVIINYNLTADGLRPPPVGLLPTADGKMVFKDEKAGRVILEINVKGLSAEQVYDALMKVLPEEPTGPEGTPGEGEGKGEGQEGGGSSKSWLPKVGDIVWNEISKEYGIITGMSGNTVNVEKITEQEAEQRAKSTVTGM